ncbi:MAG: leucine-rich repeat domain-containing protein, partial [Butyrivibrio sp.]
TSLDLSGRTVTNLDEFISQIEKLTSLTYIDMCDCGLTNEQMEVLMERFPNIKFVWKVTLGLWTIRTDCVAFSTLKDGTITYRLTNDDVKVLKYCTDMVALDLGHNKVTDLSFLQYMPELRVLILVDNRVGDTAEHYISDLSMLRYCPKLMYLEFFVGDVSDISVLGELKEMVDLNISYNPISDVTPLLNFPKLERLYLEHTNLTEEDYALLKETYPDAYIVYYGEGSVDQGWRTHERYYAMIDMFRNNYVHDLFKYEGQ